MSFFRQSPKTFFILMLLMLCVTAVSFAQDGPQPVQQAAEQLEPLGADLSSDTTSRGINFLSLLTRGGWFMVPLLLMSMAVVFIGVERALALRRVNIFPQRLVKQIGSLASQPGGLDPRKTYQICQRNPSAAARVIRSMLIKVGRPQVELEKAVSESNQREATRLSQMVSWLSLAAAVAPLVGLLGTVWGITQAFYDTTQLVDGQNRAEALAQGIYTALVTTMCGLMIAIPAAVLAHVFENRIVRLMNEIEEMIFNLMPQLERYEGKLRFSVDDINESDAVESNAIQSESLPVSAGFGELNGGDSPLPTPRASKKRPK